ncbi:MAG: TatD family nuclease-associated radical SAM protein [Elusimicrobiales bacterium]|jgi:TatD family-associated radical SAM protein
MENAVPSVVYRYKAGLYVNLTNRCPTACVFCIKNSWKMAYRGSNLDLGGAEPDTHTVLGLIKKEWAAAPFKELVFCGYGEPTMRLGALIAVAGAVKSGSLAPVPADLRVRLNTNGLGGLVNKTNIIPRLKGLIDAVHISLNTSDPAQWLAMMRPRPGYARQAFNSVLEFARGAAGVIPETVVTAIEGSGIDIKKFEVLAEELGARPRLRAKLEE